MALAAIAASAFGRGDDSRDTLPAQHAVTSDATRHDSLANTSNACIVAIDDSWSAEYDFDVVEQIKRDLTPIASGSFEDDVSQFYSDASNFILHRENVVHQHNILEDGLLPGYFDTVEQFQRGDISTGQVALHRDAVHISFSFIRQLEEQCLSLHSDIFASGGHSSRLIEAIVSNLAALPKQPDAEASLWQHIFRDLGVQQTTLDPRMSWLNFDEASRARERLQRATGLIHSFSAANPRNVCLSRLRQDKENQWNLTFTGSSQVDVVNMAQLAVLRTAWESWPIVYMGRTGQ